MGANTDIELILTGELRQVADEVRVPAMPALNLGGGTDRVHRRWLPLLVAAVIGAIIGGVILVDRLGGGGDPQPIQPPEGLHTAAPTMPYVEDRVLRDGDVVVPGKWKFVIARGDTWAALREDGTWFWDLRTGEPSALDGLDQEPRLSPDGKYLATARLVGWNMEVFVFTTRPGGEGIGVRKFASGGIDNEGYVQVVAVTDEGQVILRSDLGQQLWNPRTNRVVDLRGDQLPYGDSLAGPVWTEGLGGAAHVGGVDDQGRVADGTALPSVQVVPNAAASYGFAEGRPNTFGDQSVIETMTVYDLVKKGERSLVAPQGWHFVGGGFQWETEHHFLARVVGAGHKQRTARCSVTENRCVLVDPAR